MAPYLAVDNIFSVRQYPGHTIAATEEPSGNEAFRVADGRRSSFDYATSTTPNSEWSVTCTADQVRAVTFVALDRGHNLAGKRVIYEVSNDNFTTVETVFDISALPANPGAGSLDDALGVVTDEGAWLKRVSVRFGLYHRLRIPAMGAGLKPVIVGLWAGTGWAPSVFGLPKQENRARLAGQVSVSEAGWMGAGAMTRQRVGTLHFKLTSLFEYEELRRHLEENYGRHRPMWIVHDDEEAQRAVLATIPQEFVGLDRRTADWFYGSGEIPWTEHEPRRD
ncbi:MAG TPA: hypothetical protein VNL18_15495 [Gemmatimonadales bacterium]|nr:hypothetical protein [Gemmatimonadales bacterium]